MDRKNSVDSTRTTRAHFYQEVQSLTLPKSSTQHVDFEAFDPGNVKPNYPYSVFFIILNEFCERFAYYGKQTILTLYFKTVLGFNEDSSTVAYHVFIMLCSFTPILGAILADFYLGKFKTILYLSIIYAIGSVILSAAAIPNALPQRSFSIIGLVIIAFGTGGIRPCVAAFGGDQFVRPSQDKQLEQFFSIFYFAINCGSLISTFISPILREDVQCFGEESCFSLAFGIPAILMLLSVIIFVMGKPGYKTEEREGNVILGQFASCIWYALKRKIKSKHEKHDHWLDYASSKYDDDLIEDIKRVLRVGLVFLPLPVFWALYDQQGSRWTFQATRMNGAVGVFIIKPDQMQIVNPLLILALVPVFESLIYPCLTKCFNFTPLRRIGCGLVLCGLSFVVSGIVELQLERTYEHIPGPGLTQINFVNTLPCQVKINYKNGDLIKSFELNQTSPSTFSFRDSFEFNSDFPLQISAKAQEKCEGLDASEIWTGEINGESKEGFIVLLSKKDAKLVLTRMKDPTPLKKSYSGDPRLGFIISGLDMSNTDGYVIIKPRGFGKEYYFLLNSSITSVPGLNGLHQTQVKVVEPMKYDVFVDIIDSNVTERIPTGTINVIQGGCYVPVIHLGNFSLENKPQHKVFMVLEVTPANSVHILWLIPQYFIVTVAEVMFSVTGLAFSFTQAPPRMSSIMQGMWALIVAFGNLIVIVVAKVQGIQGQALEFFLFAGIMGAATIIFTFLALNYTYVDEPNEENDEEISLNAPKPAEGL